MVSGQKCLFQPLGIKLHDLYECNGDVVKANKVRCTYNLSDKLSSINVLR